MLARRVLSVLRKYGVKHEDTKTQSSSESIGEDEVERRGTKIQGGQGNHGENLDPTGDMKHRIHLLTPALSSKRRGREDAVGWEATSKARNTRKKTLEQRLGEAMSFVAEAQLNEDVAGKVSSTVLKRYLAMTVSG